MKKIVLFITIFCAFTNLMSISETKTMSDVQLQNLRDAVDPDPANPNRNDYMRIFWCNYIGQDVMNRDDIILERNVVEFECNTYSQNAIWGAIEHDITEYDPNFTPDQILDLARDYLLEDDPNISPDYLDLEPNGAVFNHLLDENENGGARAFTLLFLLHDVSFISDMIWYHPGVDTGALYNKITLLADFAMDEVLTETDENEFIWPYNIIGGTIWSGSEYPVANFNMRIALLGALGYAGCVIGGTAGDDYIDYALDELFHKSILPEDLPPGFSEINGYLNLLTANCGLYSEGISYTALIMESLTDFFTALYRQTGENLYDEPLIKDMLKESLHFIDPEFSFVGFDDCSSRSITRSSVMYGKVASASVMEMLLSCYNYTTDLELKAAIGWYVNGYMNHSSAFNFAFDHEPYGSISLQNLIYGTVMYRGWRGICSSLYGFDPEFSTITSYIGIPTEIAANTHTNDEFTIFRSDISTTSDFEDATLTYINHKNSFNISDHEHGDGTSFLMHYKGIPLLSDPGYGVGTVKAARKWLGSAYAHNVIIINPNNDITDVYSEDWLLEQYNLDSNDMTGFDNGEWLNTERREPRGYWPYTVDDYPRETVNPVTKNYLIENDNVKHLSINMDYVENPEPENSIVHHNRNFYYTDGDYLMIYDDMQGENTSEDNVFELRLHFAPYDNTNINYDYNLETNGMFDYEPNITSNFIKIFGASGASESFVNEFESGLPYGGFSSPAVHRQRYRHCQLKVSSQGSSKQFLTLLIPSENDTTPIDDDIISGNGYYGVRYDLDTTDSLETYVAVLSPSTASISFGQGELFVTTDANFFVFETNEDCTDVKKMILNGGNDLLINNQFDVFTSWYDSEEVIAEWTESDELEITTLMSFKSPIPLPIPNPKYKILRCGILPEDLISKTHYYSSGSINPQDRVTIGNNIESLALDSLYFYVNYSYSDLASENLLTSELIIHQGVFDGITIQGVTQFGTGDIVLMNEIPVPSGTEIVFFPGSQPQLASNFHLIVDGNLTALGTSEYNIIFDKYSSTNWGKIEITNEGNANMEFCKFLNAQFPLYNRGYIEIENCEFLDNSSGIYLDNPIGYQINRSIINNCSYGILIKDSHVLMYRSSIKNNLITNNNYGLLFYNASAYVEADTIFANKYVGYNPWSGGSLFEEGLLAESNDDLITAKTKYAQSIDENPESIEALWSISRLINCSETETEYAELLQYYDQLQINYAETDLAEAAKLDEIFCNRLLGNHQDAITEYEFLLDENLTFIDSVFTQLDIVYTYMEASSGGNRGASVTFINSENALSSFKQAEEKEVELWSLLENQITDGGIYSPEISKSILHKNYPNPFNPTTTISFSIPEQSKIQIMIYNIKGQKVKTVTNESYDKGIHSVVWNGVDDSGKSVSSGVYFYNLNVNGKSNSIKRCLLLK